MPMATQELSGRAGDRPDSLSVYSVQKHPWLLKSYVISCSVDEKQKMEAVTVCYSRSRISSLH